MIEVWLMMKPIRPNISKGASYPPEFREEAVRYWLSSGQTLAAVAADLGLSPQCLRDWRKSLETDAAPAPQTATLSGVNGNAHELALAREVGQLRRELEAMTRQRDILKKAISIFSEDKAVSGGLK
jgi:transposase